MGLSLTVRGFWEGRKLQTGSGHTFLSILGQMWPISVTYLSDYSLSDYLFFTMYIKKFFPRASGGFNPKTPFGYATVLSSSLGSNLSVLLPFTVLPNRRDSELLWLQ